MFPKLSASRLKTTLHTALYWSGYFVLLSVCYFYLNNRLEGIFETLVVFAFITSLSLLLPRYLGRILFIFIALLIGLDTSYAIVYGERISRGVLLSTVETNPSEAVGMASTLLPIFFFTLLITLAFMLVFHFITRHTSKKLSSLCSIVTLCVISFNSYSYLSVLNLTPFDFSRVPPEAETAATKHLYENYPLVVGTAAFYINALQSIDKYLHTTAHERFDDSIDRKRSKASDEEVVVVIMGETSNVDRYSAYGYGTPTTPRIEKLFATENACIIDSVHSSANLTRNSVAMTFSFATPEDESKLFTVKNIFELAKAGNRMTYWLGTQHMEGLYSVKTAYAGKYADYYAWPGHPNGTALTEEDDLLLAPELARILAIDERQFIVLHFSGSHLPYSSRYDEEDAAALPQADDYDRSIHHTDRAIAAIIETLERSGKSYSLLYTPDHGEVVNVGHGFKGGQGEQYRIPLLMKSNLRNLCSFTESLRSKEGWLSGLSNKYIISNMLGYQFKAAMIKKEIENDRVLHSDENVYLYHDLTRP